jgi:hypothetical protein
MARRRSAPSNWTNLIPRQSNFSYRLYYFGKREDEHRRVGRVQTAGLLFQRGSYPRRSIQVSGGSWAGHGELAARIAGYEAAGLNQIMLLPNLETSRDVLTEVSASLING